MDNNIFGQLSLSLEQECISLEAELRKKLPEGGEPELHFEGVELTGEGNGVVCSQQGECHEQCLPGPMHYGAILRSLAGQDLCWITLEEFWAPPQCLLLHHPSILSHMVAVLGLPVGTSLLLLVLGFFEDTFFQSSRTGKCHIYN